MWQTCEDTPSSTMARAVYTTMQGWKDPGFFTPLDYFQYTKIREKKHEAMIPLNGEVMRTDSEVERVSEGVTWLWKIHPDSQLRDKS